MALSLSKPGSWTAEGHRSSSLGFLQRAGADADRDGVVELAVAVAVAGWTTDGRLVAIPVLPCYSDQPQCIPLARLVWRSIILRYQIFELSNMDIECYTCLFRVYKHPRCKKLNPSTSDTESGSGM